MTDYDETERGGEEASIEKRTAERVTIRFAVTLTSVSNFYGFSTDLSEGGVFVALRAEVPVGSLVDLDFHLPDSDERFHVLGEVRWERTDFDRDQGIFPGYGIQFLDLNDGALEHIRAFVRSREPMAPPRASEDD